ncbi:Panacea domain-containing protein [Domibacillus indicus]|uniref:Panacea domain-containing protein n=1 Tax=Domibacillus indicus TaxID=1437523 RepID=UPI000617CC1C|nr:type II toxin-antitoxin system antitoxin SocA domain-containing protein [Domibacillus indicus]
MAKEAKNFANYFIKKEYDYPRNTFDGNMKLQKMLYFSQLIHLALQDKKLFADSMYAFKNGTVIESVRQQYQHNHYETVQEALSDEPELTEEEKRSLEIAERIFGGLDAQTLSDLNHQQYSWIESYENSKESNGYHNKERAFIEEELIRTHDLDKIKEVIDLATAEEDDDEKYEIVNGTTFYYDPNTITMNTDLLETLENFRGEDSVYSICYDEKHGHIIF